MRLIITTLMLFLIISTSGMSLFAQTSQTKISLDEKFRGTWSGTFEGDGSGKFEMLLSPSCDWKHTGEIASRLKTGRDIKLH